MEQQKQPDDPNSKKSVLYQWIKTKLPTHGSNGNAYDEDELHERSKKLSKTMFVCLAVACWWILSALATAATKKALTSDSDPIHTFWELKWIWVTFFQHATAALPTAGFIYWKHGELWPETLIQARPLLLAAVGNVLANLCTNAAYSLFSASGTQLIKACEPVFTFMIACCLYRDGSSSSLNAFTSTVIIIMGVGTTLSADPTFQLAGCIAAVLSNVGFPVRNILLKKADQKWLHGPLHKFAVMSMLSTMYLFPFISALCIFTYPERTLATEIPSTAISALSHSSFNLASVAVLEEVSPITHAILNILKRAFVVIAAMFYFKLPVTPAVPLGLMTVGFGLFAYTFKQKAFWIAKAIFLISILIYIVISVIPESYIVEIQVMAQFNLNRIINVTRVTAAVY